MFEVPEERVCAELGWSPAQVRERREYFLVKGAHWGLVKKRAQYSAVGLQILRGTKDAILEKSAPASKPQPARRVVLALLPERCEARPAFAGTLVVWRVPGFNRRLVSAHVPGLDPRGSPLNVVSVVVRENTNFLPGMVLPGPGRRLHEVEAGRFELVGSCPRWRGRW